MNTANNFFNNVAQPKISMPQNNPSVFSNLFNENNKMQLNNAPQMNQLSNLLTNSSQLASKDTASKIPEMNNSLISDDFSKFKAEKFILGTIPTEPPPKEFCI